MLRVVVYVNSKPILEGYAIRIKGLAAEDSVNTYELHNGKMIKHRYGDGAKKLAKKILNNIEEDLSK